MEDLKSNMETSLDTIGGWLGSRGLEIAPEKTEAMLVKYARRNQDVTVRHMGITIQANATAQYLGILVDASSLSAHILGSWRLERRRRSTH